MTPFYQKLNKLRKDNEAVITGELKTITTDAPESILAFARFTENNHVIVILNLSDKDVSFYVECGKLNGQYQNVFSDEVYEYNCHNLFSMQAFGFLALKIK